LTRVLRIFQLVRERERIVFGGYAALTVRRNQKLVFAEPELAGAFPRSKDEFAIPAWPTLII
jgi:hypothetical protein